MLKGFVFCSFNIFSSIFLLTKNVIFYSKYSHSFDFLSSYFKENSILFKLHFSTLTDNLNSFVHCINEEITTISRIRNKTTTAELNFFSVHTYTAIALVGY